GREDDLAVHLDRLSRAVLDILAVRDARTGGVEPQSGSGGVQQHSDLLVGAQKSIVQEDRASVLASPVPHVQLVEAESLRVKTVEVGGAREAALLAGRQERGGQWVLGQDVDELDRSTGAVHG